MRNKEKIIKDITAITAALSGVPAAVFSSLDRRTEVVLGRTAIGNFLHRELNFKFADLEKYTNRHRTSYNYYYNKHDRQYKFYPEYRHLYDKIVLAYYGNRDNTFTKEEIVTEIITNNIGLNSVNADFKIKFILGGHETNIYCKDLASTIDKLNTTFLNHDFTFNVSHINSLRYE